MRSTFISQPNVANVKHPTIKHKQKTRSEKDAYQTPIYSGQKDSLQPDTTGNKTQPTKRRKPAKHQYIPVTTFDHKGMVECQNHDDTKQPTIQPKRWWQEGDPHIKRDPLQRNDPRRNVQQLKWKQPKKRHDTKTVSQSNHEPATERRNVLTAHKYDAAVQKEKIKVRDRNGKGEQQSNTNVTQRKRTNHRDPETAGVHPRKTATTMSNSGIHLPLPT
jgi:hypothetical protein